MRKTSIILILILLFLRTVLLDSPVPAADEPFTSGGQAPEVLSPLNDGQLIERLERTLHYQCLAQGERKEILIDEPGVEQDMIRSDRPLKRSRDVENNKVYLDCDFFYKSYTRQDGSNPYCALPLLIRVDTGRNTEWWIGSDFMTWQSPACGINDISTGFKWQFREKNPSMALWTGVRLPTAGGGTGDGAVEPSALLSVESSLGGPWGLGINMGWGHYYNLAEKRRYDQMVYAAQVEYTWKKTRCLSLGCWSVCPNDLPGTRKGVNVMRLDLGYSINTDARTQYSIHLIRGLSVVDREWSCFMGVGREL